MRFSNKKRYTRSGVSKYLVQWDKEENFGRSHAGADISHADATEWSSVVRVTKYQVRRNREDIFPCVSESPPCEHRRGIFLETFLRSSVEFGSSSRTPRSGILMTVCCRTKAHSDCVDTVLTAKFFRLQASAIGICDCMAMPAKFVLRGFESRAFQVSCVKFIENTSFYPKV